MSLPSTVADVIRQHVTLEVECIDRMYLNVFVPKLQYESGVVGFFRNHRGYTFASSALMDPITKSFIHRISKFADKAGVPLITFNKGERKDDIMARYLADFQGQEGVLFVGKAQEKTPVFRTEKRRNLETGQAYPWIVRSTAMVNHYYFYCVDKDFGPFFIKFCSYFPYTAKLCINGHEYLKRQLAKRGVAFEPLDNGILSCENTGLLKALSDGLSAGKIDALLRKWLRRLPHPFTAADRAAGYRYDVSILQAEFSLTQVLDRPLTGRIFFEEVIRENLDLGRPDQVQLIFNRRVTRRTPGRFRTRVLTEGVTPSLHIDYKHSRIKQYHKEGRALRTETTINNTRDFGIGKLLHNLSALRKVGYEANRRLLDVQRISHDCTIGEDAFAQVSRPVQVQGQRASALPFGDRRVQALFQVLLLFCLLPRGFANKDLREQLASMLGEPPNSMTPGRMTYNLRRLRLHGLIERIRGTHRYRVTRAGLLAATFYTRTYIRLFRPGLSLASPEAPDNDLRRRFDALMSALDQRIAESKLAA